jgi:8-oxo-dGTP diphosphatase
MGPEGQQVVVGAAVVRAGAVLAARRTTPPAVAGRWEFPGGKVEPGETPDEAIVREIAEELGCAVEVTGWLTLTVPVTESLVLRVATVRVVHGEPEPVEHDPSHDRVRWLGIDELDDVDWLEADRPFLPEIDTLLAELGRRLRGIFFDEADAAAVAARLRTDGWDAEVVRERYHGEDDDEDHPWAVLSDAPELVMELLVDEYDGWLDDEVSGGASPSQRPPDLPTAPKRLKRPPQ